MNTRSCSNCFNFNAEPTGLNPTCWASVLIPAGAAQREPGPTDCCDLHSTHQEGAAAIAAAYPTDPELRDIVERQLTGENALKHIANKAAAEVIAGQVLGKLGKGGAL